MDHTRAREEKRRANEIIGVHAVVNPEIEREVSDQWT